MDTIITMDTITMLGTIVGILAGLIAGCLVIFKFSGTIFKAIYNFIIAPFKLIKNVDSLGDRVQDLTLFKVNQEEFNCEVVTSIDKLNRRMDDKHKLDIRNLISDFANDLRNGMKKSEAQYKCIFERYDFYKKELDGNSFIDQEMEYIKECYRNQRGV